LCAWGACLLARTGASSVYDDDVEGPLLAATVAYYGREARQLLAASDAVQYLRMVPPLSACATHAHTHRHSDRPTHLHGRVYAWAQAERRLQEEAERAAQYLDARTAPRLARVVETALLEDHASALIEVAPPPYTHRDSIIRDKHDTHSKRETHAGTHKHTDTSLHTHRRAHCFMDAPNPYVPWPMWPLR
jgi:hypothetical protein